MTRKTLDGTLCGPRGRRTRRRGEKTAVTGPLLYVYTRTRQSQLLLYIVFFRRAIGRNGGGNRFSAPATIVSSTRTCPSSEASPNVFLMKKKTNRRKTPTQTCALRSCGQPPGEDHCTRVICFPVYFSVSDSDAPKP